MGMGFYSRVISELYPDITIYGIDYEEKALRYANAVGALTATKVGVIPALPTAAAVDEFLQQRGF